jgi:hypothetical protein
MWLFVNEKRYKGSVARRVVHSEKTMVSLLDCFAVIAAIRRNLFLKTA